MQLQLTPHRSSYAAAWRLQPARMWSVPERVAGLSQRRVPRKVTVATWDPEGLLPPSSGGHFSRREKKQGDVQPAPGAASPAADQFQNEAASLLQAALAQTRPVRPIPERWQLKGGISAGDGEAYDKAAFKQQMEEHYMPVDLDFPGLRIQHLDPPIFTVEGFFTAEQCEELIAAALETGQMRASKIGAGNATVVTASNTYHSRRTSTNLVVEHGPVFRGRYPRLAASADILQRRGLALFGAGDGRTWGVPGRLPVPGQYAYEGLQVTRYEQGQHFLAHEDAFPVPMARQNKFNRHATLLLYLNSVPDGGATRFDQLNIAVQPQQGSVLLFFPSFADGSPDARTLHTASDAIQTKWVSQQWVARGLQPPAQRPEAAAASEGSDDEEFPFKMIKKDGKIKIKEKKKTGSGKGFGRK